MSEIPDERSILKQDLWKRIDDSNVARTSALGDIDSRFENFYVKIQARLNQDTENQRIKIEAMQRDLLNEITAARQALQGVNAEFSVQLRKNFDAQVKAFEKRLADFEISIRGIVKTEVKAYFEPLTNQIKSLENDVAGYQKDTSQQIKLSQEEMRTKLGAMMDLFNRVKERFKAIADIVQ